MIIKSFDWLLHNSHWFDLLNKELISRYSLWNAQEKIESVCILNLWFCWRYFHCPNQHDVDIGTVPWYRTVELQFQSFARAFVAWTSLEIMLLLSYCGYVRTYWWFLFKNLYEYGKSRKLIHFDVLDSCPTCATISDTDISLV